MLSATAADNNDSIAPNNAMVKAGLINSVIKANEQGGNFNEGNVCGMPPKLVPIVATESNLKMICKSVATM